jgi:hypothetical protein
VLENYRVPDLTNPINPLAAHEMVSRERMHGQELEQTKQRQKAKAQEDRDKALGDLKIEQGTSGTIYDPTGLKATQDLNIEMMEYAKSNPDKSIAEIKMHFAPQANKISQYYEKAKTIKANNKVALEGLQKLGGYNLSEIDLLAQKEALIDPTTGKIRDDIDMIDVTQPYWKMAIEKNPLETTTNEGLHEYVTKAETTPSRVKVKRVDRNKGMVTDELELSVPSFIQVERDAKGNPVISETGTYGLETKFETLPNGTKILEEGVFKDLKSNQPSAYQRLMGEVANYIKTNNDESDDNIAPDSVEAQNIARMLAYKDIKQVWGNKGVKKYDAVVQPPAPRITINNNSGSGKENTQAIYNDTWGRIRDAFEQSKKNKLESTTDENEKKRIESGDYLISMNTLDTDAINLISKQVNEGRAEANKIDPDDMYVNFTPNGGIRIYRAETDKEKISKMRIPEYMKRKDKIGFIDKDHLIATLPPSSNLKTPQANTESKVSAQEEAKQREEEIKNQKGKKVYKIGNKEFTEEQLQKGADKNKMSLADYKKSIGL